MAEVRETQVTRDADGNIVDRQTVIEKPRKKNGFGWGMLLGVLIIAGGIVAFAYNQGSFQTAGRDADRATQTAQVQIDRTANNAQQAINNGTPPSTSSSTTDTTQSTQQN